MESDQLDAASVSYRRAGRLTMHVNKVHHVTTIIAGEDDLDAPDLMVDPSSVVQSPEPSRQIQEIDRKPSNGSITSRGYQNQSC